MHSSTSNFERVIPTQAVARDHGQRRDDGRPSRRRPGRFIAARSVTRPALNDTGDLWAEARRRVEPESLVIVGDSRALFDSDLDELEKVWASARCNSRSPAARRFQSCPI